MNWKGTVWTVVLALGTIVVIKTVSKDHPSTPILGTLGRAL